MLRLFRLFVVAFFQTLRRRLRRGPARPTWSFGFELILRFLRCDWDATASWSLPRVRQAVGSRPYPKDMVKKVVTRDAALGGVPARWFVPPGAGDTRAILFFHGGSFVYGSATTTHADLLARLALASGIAVVGVDYRLAPEFPFPAQREDALAAWTALVEEVPQVVVAGDSAGGNLAIELQLALRDSGRPQASATIAMSPWSDLRMPGRSFEENDAFDFGDRATLAVHAKAFAGGVSLDDPRVSPLCADLTGLAPTFVSVGEVEIPRDDILALVAALRAAGVEVHDHVAKDMPHNPAVFAAYHPNGQAALDAAARFARESLDLRDASG